MAEFSRESLSEERASARMKKKSWSGKWLIVVIILLVLLFGSFFYQFFVAKNKAKQYFAVSLNSGQIYFGRLTRTTANTVTLKNVYFIQVQQAEQNKQPQLSLQSILTTLPQPKDEIMLFKQAIISIMPLRDDSQVAQFIKQQQLISSGAIPPLPLQQQAPQPQLQPAPLPQAPAPQENPQK